MLVVLETRRALLAAIQRSIGQGMKRLAELTASKAADVCLNVTKLVPGTRQSHWWETSSGAEAEATEFGFLRVSLEKPWVFTVSRTELTHIRTDSQVARSADCIGTQRHFSEGSCLLCVQLLGSQLSWLYCKCGFLLL